jgi:hypothetical protein
VFIDTAYRYSGSAAWSSGVASCPFGLGILDLAPVRHLANAVFRRHPNNASKSIDPACSAPVPRAPNAP